MDRNDPNFRHDRPRASLCDAVPLLTEMLRQLIEEEGKASFLNAKVEGGTHNLGVTHHEVGTLDCFVGGKGVVKTMNDLDKRGLERLRQRGWWRSGEENDERISSEKQWSGVTTHTDRRHVAKDMISVLTDVYEVPADQKIYVQLRLHGMRSSYESGSEGTS